MEKPESIEEKKPVGRPPKFSTPEQLEEMIKQYFSLFGKDSTDEEREASGIEIYENRPTITGLCLFLGFDTRQSFYDYEKLEGFTYTIKKARTKIENLYENMLGSKATIGGIFALKNFGWEDKSQFDHTTAGEKMSVITTMVDGQVVDLKK